MSEEKRPLEEWQAECRQIIRNFAEAVQNYSNRSMQEYIQRLEEGDPDAMHIAASGTFLSLLCENILRMQESIAGEASEMIGMLEHVPVEQRIEMARESLVAAAAVARTNGPGGEA